MSQVCSISYPNYNVIFKIKIFRNIATYTKKKFYQLHLSNCKALCKTFFDYLHFKGLPPSYLALASLKSFVGPNAKFTAVKLDGVNYLIQFFLQTHNLQRLVFRIFRHQSSKMISNKAKKITKLASMNGVIQLSSHPPQTGIKGFWISNLLSLFSQGVVEGPFYINHFHNLAVV